MLDGLRVEDDFGLDDVDREAPRGDFAADDFVFRDAVLFDVLLAAAERPVFAEREPALLVVRPPADVFDRAEVVARDEDDLALPLLGELLLEPAREDELLPLTRDEEDPALLLLRTELFFDELAPRLDELLLRPPAELFLVDEDPVDDRLLLVLAAPFLPGALFLADVLRDEPPDDRVLEADLFEPPPDDLELEPEDLFEPADEDRDDDALLFEPPLLPELFDERELVDFLVVAMRIFPPVDLDIPVHVEPSAIFVPVYLCINLRHHLQ